MVSKITEILLTNLGWEPNAVLRAKSAALLHDVGKNFVPKEILDKPGNLTSEEYAIVKTHAELGYEYLISKSHEAKPLGWEPETLQLAAIVAGQHHERIDGSGYTGMKGNEIHPVAKYVAVSDVFDALYSYRPYKEAWPIAEIMESFLEGYGTLYEPMCIDVLFECLDEILSLYHETPESNEY